MDQPILCPKCRQIDKIEKVSSIVRRQTQWNAGQIQATALAVTLMPPPEPELKVRTTGAVIGPSRKSCLGEVGFAANVALFAIMGIAVIVLSIALSIGLMQAIGSSAWPLLVLGVVFGIGLLAFDVWYYISSQQKLSSAESVHQAEIDKWKGRMREWEDLYYCYRDDIVFNPNSGKCATSRDMDTLYS